MTATVIGTAGQFTVLSDGTITGPAGYMETAYDQAKIIRSVKLFAQVSDVPTGQLIATALQTDYAAWLGQRQLAAMVGR